MSVLPPFAQASPAAGIGALRVEGLSIGFGGVRVVQDLAFDVGDGEIVSLIGPNGAGKTTVLNCVGGLTRAQRGSIHYAGRDLIGMPAHARARLGIGRTFQNLHLFGCMTAMENLLVAQHTRIRTGLFHDLLRLPARGEERRAREHARDLLGRLDLGQVAQVRADTLPFGQQKMLGVARCLAFGPRLVLLDEPAAGLNQAEAQALGAFIRALRTWYGDGRVAVLLVEHNMGVVMRISDRVIVLAGGTKLAEGQPEEVRRLPRVIEAYLGPTGEV